ncbi:MAG TPA: ATP-binding protein [Candidatus Limnocylindria bacterium]|nr:ATP-binding protein [Candidatus Limnocylindria bacterium]
MPDEVARPPRARPEPTRAQPEAYWGLRTALVTLAMGAAVMAVAVVVKTLLLYATSANAGFVIYIPAVAVVAWYRGLLGGVLATLLGAVADSVLFVPALFVVAANLESLQLRLLAYLAGGTAVSYLAYRLRSERDRAHLESTERRQALDRAAQMSDELGRIAANERRASELRDAFNSIVSHELRTPITAIYGGAKLLARRDRQLDDATRQELIDDLETEADRLYRLVEDLLVLSRSEGGTLDRSGDPVAMAHLVRRVTSSEQARWPGSKFQFQSTTSTTARGDETYVEQVLCNLLSNAAKYSPAGTKVEVIVDETPEGVRVRVLDSGAGVREEEVDRLFQLYYRSPQTAAKAGGAGIGLFVCRVLVEAMGGRIWAAPRPQGGAEFGFVLRLHEVDNLSSEAT